MTEGRIIDAEAMESRTVTVEIPKDRTLSHRGSFPGLGNLVGFAFPCCKLILDQKSLYSFYLPFRMRMPNPGPVPSLYFGSR